MLELPEHSRFLLWLMYVNGLRLRWAEWRGYWVNVGDGGTALRDELVKPLRLADLLKEVGEADRPRDELAWLLTDEGRRIASREDWTGRVAELQRVVKYEKPARLVRVDK